MDWRERVPQEVSDVELTPEGFQGKIALQQDEEGYFGRGCPSCERFFKMRVEDWSALPTDAKITCPYCGHQADDPSDFLSSAQQDYAQEALTAMAEQYAFEQARNMFKGLQASTRNSPHVRVTVSDDLPPRRTLQSYVEEVTRRVIVCDNCGTSHAVYGATAFCPICGPRPASVTVLESIERAEDQLALEEKLPADVREDARASGLFDKHAADAVKEVVSLFEVFTRDQFVRRVGMASAEALVKGKGNIFQRLADADQLFADHAGFSLTSLVPATTWDRLRQVFAQRHVLIHKDGIVDQKYLDSVASSNQSVGQKLVISRKEAEEALSVLREFVSALAAK